MATSSIGQVVKLDKDSAKAFLAASKKPSKPVNVKDSGMTRLTDFSVLKHVK